MSAAHCHRRLLARDILPTLGDVDGGEIAAGRRAQKGAA